MNGAKCIRKAIDEAFGLVTTVAPGVPGVPDFVWISLKIAQFLRGHVGRA